MKRRSLYFVKPFEIEVREESLPKIGPEELMLATEISAISPGSEMLVYRGELPENNAQPSSLDSVSGNLSYPVKYGYSTVAKVVDVGSRADAAWRGQRVFAFQPHQSQFVSQPEELLVIPDDVPDEDAIFLPNMETAVNLIMDGQPMLGEQVAVFGQGIVGLLLTSLLSNYPLGDLLTLDNYENRRNASIELGAHHSLAPNESEDLDEIHAACKASSGYPGADLTYELSGHPATLDAAIAITGFYGRIVIGSWYGNRRAEIDLGGKFHRSRIRLIASQVSTITPELSARWDKPRRFQTAWEMLRRVKPAKLISHRFGLEDAAQAYELIDKQPGEVIQVALTYK